MADIVAATSGTATASAAASTQATESLFSVTYSMTAPFTPSSSCATEWTYEASNYNSITGGLLMQNLNQGQINTDCFPTDFGAYGRAPSSIQIYSPGACPVGYVSPSIAITSGTTTAVCCPSGFNFISEYSSINYFGTDAVLFAGCQSTYLSGSTTVPARAAGTSLTDTTVVGPITMWGQPITVEFQQSDLTLFPSPTSSTTKSKSKSSSTSTDSSTSSSHSAAAASTSSSISSPTPTPTNLSTTGLSTGAKAGIAVGAVVGALLILGAIFFFLRRRGRKDPAYGAAPTNEKIGSAAPYQYQTHELEGFNESRPHELPATNKYRPDAPMAELE